MDWVERNLSRAIFGGLPSDGQEGVIALRGIMPTSVISDSPRYKLDVTPAQAGTHATLRACNGSVSWVPAIVLEAHDIGKRTKGQYIRLSHTRARND